MGGTRHTDALGCLVLLVLSAGLLQGSWAGAEALPQSQPGSSSLVLASEPLVVPSGGLTDQAQQVQAAREAQLASPEEVLLREKSQSAYENFDAAEATHVDLESFAPLMREPVGGPPSLPAGQTVTGFAADNVAQVDLGEGRRAVVESIAPMALESSSGVYVPVNLAVTEDEGVFAPSTPVTSVRMPRSLSDGIVLPEAGVSLVPVDSTGSSLTGSAGAIAGATVLYANTQPDVDTAVKPLVHGVDLQSILRSNRSPERLMFRVIGPAGSQLLQLGNGSGPIEVSKEGQIIAKVQEPFGVDAAGTSVPVGMVLSGDTVTLSVEHPTGRYRYPINVDPSITDYTLLGAGAKSNWKAVTWNGSYTVFKFAEVNERELVDSVEAPHNVGEWGEFAYDTQGGSSIIKFSADTFGYTNPLASPEADKNTLGIVNHSGAFEGTPYPLPGYYSIQPHELSVAGSAGNAALFIQTAEVSNSEFFEGNLVEAGVTVSQSGGPTASIDTGDATVNGFPNAGNGQWVSPPVSRPVFAVSASDEGIGIYKTTLTSPQELPYGNPYKTAREPEPGCSGIQCYECWNWSTVCTSGTRPDGLPVSSGTPLTFNFLVAEAGEWFTWLPDGEDSVTATVENATGTKTTVSGTVRIDSTPPHNVVFGGLPSGDEVGEGISHVTVEATDGSGTTPSSGLASIALFVDGREVPSSGSNNGCTKGPCTGKAEWALDGAEYGPGKHSLTAVATDRAGNRATQTETLTVHPATPINVGPGAVDPQSGEFTVQSTDVSVGGLSVTRDFGSRRGEGVESGPLGAQWGISLAGSERLTELANSNVLITSATGGATIFAHKESGGFEPPKGNSNLTLESTGAKYVLKNVATLTSTEFTQPEGSSYAIPAYAKSIGWPGAANGAFKTPDDAVTDSKGNLWVVDQVNSRIEEFNEKSEYIKQFGTFGSGQSEFNEPRGIAFDPKGNFWVADSGNDRLEKFNAQGQYMEAVGKPGSGEAQFSYPKGVAVDSKGNVWVADSANDRLQEFTELGQFIRFVTSASTGGVLGEPAGVAVDSKNNVWVSDSGHRRVDELSETGSVIRYFGEQGTSNGKFEFPLGIAVDAKGDVWVGDWTLDRVQEFGEKGEYLAQFGTQGTSTEQFEKPNFISLSSRGTIWVADAGNNRIQQWTHPTWVPTVSQGTVATDKTTYQYVTTVVNGKPVTQPKEALAPVPVGVSCGGEIGQLKPGCRALSFNYASTTTATGDNPSEWGDYEGHLTRVYYTAWNPATKAMKTVEVAHYLYDKKGRLRTEWDPRISPNLKTLYGYSEGYLTSISPPGEQPWLMTYGTTASDGNPGHLLKIRRPGAKTALGSGELAKNTERPVISGMPIVGKRLAVSEGKWLGTPLTYAYQWERCFSIAGFLIECKAIPGATNPNYTPSSGDVGYVLVGQVIATNSGGSTTASSAASATVEAAGTGTEGAQISPQPGVTIEYNVPLSGTGLPTMTKSEVQTWGQEDYPVEGTAILRADKPQGWPAGSYEGATLYYLDEKSHTVNVKLPSGGIATSEFNATNEVTRSLSADNRATALKEAKPAEAAKLLDTQSQYSSDGTELLSTLGPQHTVKLVHGRTKENEEVAARSHTVFSYDEGAPETGGPYRLATKVRQGAKIEGETKEYDISETRSYYSGQSGLGWRLRQPTSVVTDPAGLDLVHSTVYDETTGNVLEAKTPGGTVESVYPPVFSKALGSEGSGSGQFNHPEDTAIDLSGNLWVDDQNNHRLQEFSPSGTLIGTYGSEGTGEGQFKNVWGLTVDPTTGNIVVSDEGNERIDVFSSTGKFIRMFGSLGSGNGQLNGPNELTVDSHGNIWVADRGNNRIEEFSSTGTYESQFGASGSEDGQMHEPRSVVISEGELFVLDSGNNRIEEFTTAGTFLAKFGSEGTGPGQLKKPEGLSVNQAGGNLYVSDSGNERIEEFSPAGRFLAAFGWYGTTIPGLHGPTGLAVGPTGTIYIADQYNARIDEWQSAEAGGARMVYSAKFGSKGSGQGQFFTPVGTGIDGQGNVWVVDFYNARVQEFSPTGQFLASYGSKGSGNGQFNEPTGLGINTSTGNVYVGDCGNKRIEELGPKGEFIRTFGTAGSEPGQLSCMGGVKVDSAGNVWVADAHNNRIQEFSATGSFIAAYGSVGTGNGQFKQPEDIAFSGGNMYITDLGNDRVQELSMSGVYIRQFGSLGSEIGQFNKPEAIIADSAGHLFVDDNLNKRIQEFNQTGGFLAAFGSPSSGEGSLTNPTGMAINASGDIYIADGTNNDIEIWAPANQAVHNTQTIYYSAPANAEHPECGEHPEWANMPCRIQPAAQPTGPGAHPLPTSTITYNMWQEPETTRSTVVECVKVSPGTGKYTNSACTASGTGEYETKTYTRTTTGTFDEAGRPLTSETTATVGTALPAVSDKYNATTGLLTEQSQTVEGKTQTIAEAYNSVEQMTAYTDADGNTTKYEYEEELDMRLTHVDDGKGGESFKYEKASGLVSELTDTQGTNTLTFTATHDVEGNLVTQGYPNGMTANYSRDAAGEQVGLSYVKNTNCTENCTWLYDNAVPSIHGQWLSQSSSLGSEHYAYDSAKRLVQVQETPTGEGCTTRLYSLDEETNRRSLTTRSPGVGGACATEGGTVEAHTYESANRLTDPGVGYAPFGETTKLPAGNAGGTELQSGFYIDGQLATQTQGAQTLGYKLDPSGRTRETIDTGTVNATTISHYTGPGSSPAWTIEPVSSHWSRYVSGITGFAAIETDTQSPELKLSDLQGNIVASASISETATKLLRTERPTEYGVPTTTKPEKYSWLGADLRATELPSGVVAMGARSYIPQLGRFLQTDPVPGGSANAYAYTYGDPVNTSDPSGEFTYGGSEEDVAGGNITGQEAIAAAQERAIREEAERKAAEGGDPCTTSFAQGHVSMFGKQFISAWTTLSWCYSGGHVLSAKIKNHGDHTHNHWWWPEIFGFKAWESSAYWLSDGVYFVEEVAAFTSKVPDVPVPDEWEGGVTPTTTWYITMKFELFPDGESKAWAMTWCEPLC